MQKFALLFLAIAATAIMVLSMGGVVKKSGISGGVSTVVPTQSDFSSSVISQTVPFPTGDDVIRTFVQLINEKKIPEAISMMDATLVPSDSAKQQYGVVFNSFSKNLIQEIGPESFGKEEWGEGEERYRVDLQITKKPGSQENLWDEGLNTRWITVLKQQDRFMIHDIATGP